MKKLALALVLIWGASTVSAQVFKADPPEPEPEEVSSDSGSSSDATPALILLALIGAVVASSQMGLLATRNNNALDIKASDAEDDAGF